MSITTGVPPKSDEAGMEDCMVDWCLDRAARQFRVFCARHEALWWGSRISGEEFIERQNREGEVYP